MLKGLAITEVETIPVRVSHRTAWLFIRLHTNKGFTGLGEVSLGASTQLPELDRFGELARQITDGSVSQFRRRGRALAALNLRTATAFSGIEMALWDIIGKVMGVPVYQLLGGQLRASISAYANINRMTRERNPEGFAASARSAVEAGFKALKAAPFDGFPVAGQASAVREAEALGIDSLYAMRQAVGEDISIKVDCHSYFREAQAIEIARQLCAAIQNVESIELQWGEVPWRKEIIDPPEYLANGKLIISDRPGIGISLNDDVVKEHRYRQ